MRSWVKFPTTQMMHTRDKVKYDHRIGKGVLSLALKANVSFREQQRSRGSGPQPSKGMLPSHQEKTGSFPSSVGSGGSRAIWEDGPELPLNFLYKKRLIGKHLLIMQFFTMWLLFFLYCVYIKRWQQVVSLSQRLHNKKRMKPWPRATSVFPDRVFTATSSVMVISSFSQGEMLHGLTQDASPLHGTTCPSYLR